MFSKNIIKSMAKLRNLSQSRCLSELKNKTQLNKSSITKRLCIRNALITEPDSEQLFCINGWVKSTRKQKPTAFIHIDDGSDFKYLQVVLSEELLQKVNSDLYNGCTVQCIGQLVSSQGKQQNVELLCHSIEILGKCDPNSYPFAQRNRSYKNSYFRDNLHLRVRVKSFSSITRLRSEMMNAIHIFMKQNNFVNITTPIITSNDCEGGGHVFKVKSPFCTSEDLYFGKEAYLTVSSQLQLEAMACALSRVYTLNQSFRAEKSKSPKHLSEFLMFEVEEAFIQSLDDIMKRVETICKFIAYYLSHNCSEDLNYIISETNYKYFDKIANSQYIRMTYSEAMEILLKSKKFPNLKSGQNLNDEQEKTLVQYTNYSPVFITHFPSNIKPFYTKQIDGQALCFDLLSPVCGEICGGSIREDNYEELAHRINELESAEDLEWYLDLRRYGSALHGGFGIGFDRFLQTMIGISNIKDVTSFPRWRYHCML